MEGKDSDVCHVLIGILGLLVENVEVFADVDEGLERARELAESFKCKVNKDDEKPSASTMPLGFYATDEEGLNEVHLWINVEIKRKPSE